VRSIAEGFTRVTNSLVNDIILPPLSALFPLNRNLDEKFAVLKPGPNYDSAGGYTTLRQAIDDGAVVMGYGVFINRVINFVGIGVALYALAKLYQLFSKAPIIKATVKCRYCRKSINEKVGLPVYPPRPVIRLTGPVAPLHQLHKLARWTRRAHGVMHVQLLENSYEYM